MEDNKKKQIDKNNLGGFFKFLSNTKEGQSYTVAGITFLLIVLVLVFGVIPSLSATVEQMSENQVRRDTLEALDQKIYNLGQLSFQYNEKQRVVQIFNDSFREGFDHEYVVKLINDAIVRNQIFFASISFTEVDPNFQENAISENIRNLDNNVKAYTISLRVEGRKDSLVNFVRELENSKYIFNIESISLSGNDDTTVFDIQEGREFSLNLQIQTYYWDPNVVPPVLDFIDEEEDV